MESLRRATLEGVKAKQLPECCSAARQVVAAGDLSRGCRGDKPGAASAGRISGERSPRTPSCVRRAVAAAGEERPRELGGLCRGMLSRGRL